jgi:hypothetical protein
MVTPLSRKQLDPAGCGQPNCGHDHSVLYLHSVCHPNAGTRVSYEKLTGLLTVACRRCQKLVAHVKVADQ